MSAKYKILKGERDGKQWFGSVDSIFRTNPTSLSRYGFACEVWVELNKQTSSGLPTKEEFQDLEKYEEKIKDCLTKDNEGIEVGKISWNNIRYLLYYVFDPQVSSSNLNSFLEGSDWTVDYSIFSDSKFKTADKNFSWE